MSLKETLTAYWLHIQEELLPWLDDTTCGPLSGHHRQLVSVLSTWSGSKAFLAGWHGLPGRPPCERAVPGEGLYREGRIQHSDHQPADRDAVRRQDVAPLMWLAACAGEVPSRSTFSRASRGRSSPRALCHRGCTRLLDLQDTHSDRLVGQYLYVTGTAIEARDENRRNQTSRQRNQNPNLSVAVPARESSARRRRRKVEIERQRGMTLAAMLADLPRACDVGAKRNAKGFKETWIGYKLHIDTADGEIPISCVLTAASVH